MALMKVMAAAGGGSAISAENGSSNGVSVKSNEINEESINGGK
jgi:hypothetical protein